MTIKKESYMVSAILYLDRLSEFYLGSSKIAQPSFFPTDAQVYDGQKALYAGISYFCSASDLDSIREAECGEGSILFVCGCTKETAVQVPKDCLGIFLSCPVSKAFNLLSMYGSAERRGLEELNRLISSGGNAHQFILKVAELTGGDTLLLDDSLKIIFTSNMHINGRLKNALSGNGELPEGLAEELLLNPHRYRDNVGISVDHTYGTAVFTTRAVSPSGLSTTMLLEIPNRRETDAFTLMYHAQRMLSDWMLSGGFANAARIQTSFQSVWDKIKIGDTLNDAEMVNVFENLPHPIVGKICVAAICFNSYENIPYNYVLAKIRNLDRDINVAIENKDIIMVLPPSLVSPGVRSSSLENNASLYELLESFNACMMYGNYTGRARHVKDIYYLTKKVLVIAEKINTEKNKRIFFYEDFASYAAIDIAAQSYLKQDVKQDAYMLVHPTVLDLTVYDREHSDNLADVLFFYLANERNLKKTADDMHMHRNTVLNKLKKIESIVNLDFEDFRLRQRLVFSSQFIRYYEKVLEMALPLKTKGKSRHDKNADI